MRSLGAAPSPPLEELPTPLNISRRQRMHDEISAGSGKAFELGAPLREYHMEEFHAVLDKHVVELEEVWVRHMACSHKISQHKDLAEEAHQPLEKQTPDPSDTITLLENLGDQRVPDDQKASDCCNVGDANDIIMVGGEPSVAERISAVLSRPGSVHRTVSAEEELAAWVVRPTEKLGRVQQDPLWCSEIANFLESSTFDAVISSVLMLNILFMALEMQLQGRRAGYGVYYDEVSPSDADWEVIKSAMQFIDYAFTIIFALDVTIRIVFLRRRFFTRWINYLDLLGVIVSLVVLGFGDGHGLPVNPVCFRMLRFGKVARAVRMLALSAKLETFGLLVKSLLASMGVMSWTFVVLVFVQALGGLMIGTLIQDFILDETNDLSARRDVYQWWGTFTRTFLTMFEVLFGNWGPPCRSLVNNISEMFSLVFLFYRCMLGVALINIVNSIFITQTMKYADQDEQWLIKKAERDQQQDKTRLLEIFHQVDASGNGVIERAEFNSLVHTDLLRVWLKQLGLDATDLVDLFELIDDGDGKVDWQEFLNGAGRMKGAAKRVDVLRLETKVENLIRKLRFDGVVARSSRYS